MASTCTYKRYGGIWHKITDCVPPKSGCPSVPWHFTNLQDWRPDTPTALDGETLVLQCQSTLDASPNPSSGMAWYDAGDIIHEFTTNASGGQITIVVASRTEKTLDQLNQIIREQIQHSRAWNPSPVDP